MSDGKYTQTNAATTDTHTRRGGKHPHPHIPVRDDDGGPVHHEPVQRLLHQILRVRVQRRRRLVQDKYLWVLHDRARDGDALLLPARQPRTSFAHHSLVALRERLDERVRVGELGRSDDVPRVRVLHAEPDVFRDARAEEDGILVHQLRRRVTITTR